MTMRILALLAAAALLIGAAAASARPPTPAERSAISDVVQATLDNDDLPEVNDCRSSYLIRVSSLRPRTAVVRMNLAIRERIGCLLGNGVLYLRRPSPQSQAWRFVEAGPDDLPPCRLVTSRMARELGFVATFRGRRCDPSG